jgi:hypothetical protein
MIGNGFQKMDDYDQSRGHTEAAIIAAGIHLNRQSYQFLTL